MNERVTKLTDGLYSIACNPRRFDDGEGRTHCPPEGPVVISFQRGGVTADDLRAILSDFAGQPPAESPEKKSRGRRPVVAAEPNTAPE